MRLKQEQGTVGSMFAKQAKDSQFSLGRKHKYFCEYSSVKSLPNQICGATCCECPVN